MQTVIPGLYQIALPTHFQIGDVNAFLAEGDSLTLIDTGVDSEESYNVLRSELAALGHKIADIQRLIITHHHIDHIGAAHRIIAESGAEVLAHPITARWLQSPNEMQDILGHYMDVAFREGAVPEDLIGLMKREFLRPRDHRIASITCIDEGDIVPIAGHPWRVYFTPGHAGGLICFYQPEQQVLLSSDHLLLKVSSNPLIEAPLTPGAKRPPRLLEYIREMDRIASLKVRIAYTGHGDPITDVRGLVDSRLAFHRKRATKLFSFFEGQPGNLYDLTQRMFPQITGVDVYLTLSEVLGHLDILEQEVQIVRELYAGIVYWKPAYT